MILRRGNGKGAKTAASGGSGGGIGSESEGCKKGVWVFESESAHLDLWREASGMLQMP